MGRWKFSRIASLFSDKAIRSQEGESQELIRVRSLSKSFFDKNGIGKEILKGVSFDLYRGEILVIVGKSGMGKSILLRHLVGLEVPDSGFVYYAQDLKDIKGNLKSDSIGLVFQGGALFDFLSVRENIMFPLRYHGSLEDRGCCSEKEMMERSTWALEQVGLSGCADVMPSELSGGMRKRVSLARSMVYSPKVLLYDEPTSGLDPITGREIALLIKRLRDEFNISGIVVTHDMSLALSIADRIAVHDKGVVECIDRDKEGSWKRHPLLQKFFEDYGFASCEAYGG